MDDEELQQWAIWIWLAVWERRAPAVAKFAPGNGSEWTIVFTPVDLIRESEPTGWGVEPETSCVVSILGRKSYPFDLKVRGWIAPDYVQEKLGVSMQDAEQIARLFEAIGWYGKEKQRLERQAVYATKEDRPGGEARD